MGQRPLPQIEIDGCHFLPEIEQSHRHVHGNRRFSCTTFLVPEHHNIRRWRLSPARLHQHHAT